MRPSRRTTAMVAPLLAVSLAMVACDDGADATPSSQAAPAASEAAEVSAAPPTAEPGPETEPPPTEPPPTEPVDLSTAIRGTSAISGPDLMAALDPNDPAQAANIADIVALLDATGADLDQLTLLNAVSLDGQAFVGGMRLDRVDVEAAKDSYVESTFDNLGEPRVEETEMAGRPVTAIYDDAAPDQPPLIVLASNDTVWLISGPPESAAAVVEALP